VAEDFGDLRFPSCDQDIVATLLLSVSERAMMLPEAAYRFPFANWRSLPTRLGGKPTAPCGFNYDWHHHKRGASEESGTVQAAAAFDAGPKAIG
jgi:hypothetical protein